MKKRSSRNMFVICFAVFAIISLLVICNFGCNCRGYDFIDTNYHFNRAIIKDPNGEVFEIQVKMWADSEGEQLTITSVDGTRYLVHSANVLMIEDND